MKHFFFLLLTITLLSTACQNDDEAIPEDCDTSGTQWEGDIHYDCENFAAPLLDGGTHIAAVRFTSEEMEAFNGQKLDEVVFYIDEVPQTCILTIRGENTPSNPGDIFYTADLSGDIGPDGWNSYKLNNPIPIDNEDLWICIEFSHSGSARTVGCDPGPAQADADWMTSTTNNNTWETLRNYTDGETDINWNIRGRVSP